MEAVFDMPFLYPCDVVLELRTKNEMFCCPLYCKGEFPPIDLMLPISLELGKFMKSHLAAPLLSYSFL